MRMPLPALGLTVVVCISSSCPRADEARGAPSAVKWSRASQPGPVLRGCWRKRLCSRNARPGWRGVFQYRRRGRKALRLLRQWMLAG